MKTLYDLLEALPHDDADGLRAAFRRAVKGAHPDLRPGDPDAALKFRQIVRASEILGDAEQRAAYDDLLEVARLEHESASRHPIAGRVHRFASGVMALAGACFVTAGGYLLFMHMSAASMAVPNHADAAARASLGIVAVDPARASPEKSVPAVISGQPAAAGTAMPPASADSAAAANDGRARGISLHRDLNDSFAELDQALQLDPKFLPAYVDRGMIFYRMQKSNRLFTDAPRTNRIERTVRSRSAPAIAKRPPVEQAQIAPLATPLFRRRTAAQDPSRSEGFASAMR
jgi:curved DNA-binding protein CbpA